MRTEKISLEEILAEIKLEHLHGEISMGREVGKEVLEDHFSPSTFNAFSASDSAHCNW